MATRRRIGVSIATTEAARRQLMQPVPCWEKAWISSPLAPNIKIYKWVKTEKTQQFDGEEGGVDEPLAPLPDEPEVVDGDEEDTEDPKNADPTRPKDTADVETNPDSKVPSPGVGISALPSSTLSSHEEPLDVPLKDNLTDDLDSKKDDTGSMLDLDMTDLGPDGLQLEGVQDLSQLDPADGLMGPSLLDDSADPFEPQP